VSRPRVLMVTGAYYPELSGAGLQCRQLVRALAGRVDFEVLTTSTSIRPVTPKVDGVPVHRVYVDVRNRRSTARAGAALGGAFLRVAHRIDIVHFHGFSRKSILLMALATALRKRRMVKLTSVGHDDPVAMCARGGAALHAYRRADLYVGVSPRQAELYRAAGLPPGRFVLIPNGVDVVRFRPAHDGEQRALRVELGLPVDLPLVLFVGFFSRDKQPHVLFDAWRRRPEPSTLVFVGATRSPYYEVDTGLAEGVRSSAAQGGLDDRLRLVERTDVVERYYRAADVFVLPSLREGLPNALLEAMASGLACVASRLPGVTDALIEDGRTGVLVPPGDATAVGESLAVLLADATLRRRLGTAARRSVEAGYTLERAAARHLEVYRTLIGLGDPVSAELV
jgi:glycosyltransferase involved in cell wall biosynthesis